MATNGLNFDALLDALAQKVVEKLDGRMSGSGARGAVRPRLLTVEQAALYMGRSKTGIQHLIAGRALPVVRSDRRVFLDREDLDRWIEQSKV